MKAEFDSVPVAIPRKWLKDWILTVWELAFGRHLGTIQPFRWIMFRDLSARERMAMLEETTS